MDDHQSRSHSVTLQSILDLIDEHEPPPLQQSSDQSTATRSIDARAIKFLHSVGGALSFQHDPQMLQVLDQVYTSSLPQQATVSAERRSMTAETPSTSNVPSSSLSQVPGSSTHATVDLPIDIFAAQAHSSLAARLVTVKTEVRDLYPFFQHHLFVMFSALLIVLALSLKTYKWDLLAGTNFSADFGLYTAESLFAIMEVKRSAVVLRQTLVDFVVFLRSRGSSEPLQVKLIAEDEGTGEEREGPQILYDRRLSPRLFESIMQVGFLPVHMCHS